MRRCVFLCGVSGVGKSTAGKKLQCRTVSVVEMDQVIRAIYPLLKVGHDANNPYRFDHWQSFLSANGNSQAVLRTFGEYLLGSKETEVINLLLIGNHFLIPVFEQVLLDTLTPLGFQPPLKLLLDIDWKTVYTYRKQRGTFRDQLTSKEDVIQQISDYQNNLHPRGYHSVNASELDFQVRKYFQLL